MERCLTVEDGVRRLLDAYRSGPTAPWRYVPAGDGDLADRLILDGAEVPLFWWRCDPQVDKLHELAPRQRICSMKLNRACARSEGLERLLYKELDVAEYVMDTRVRTVMNFRSGNSMNMLCTMENDRVALFELTAALCDGTPEQGRHTCWGENGMASDRVVSQKVTNGALYLFTQDRMDPEVYNDLSLTLYGLDKTAVLKASMIAEILLGRRDVSDWERQDAHYRRCIAAAARSDREVCRLTVEEG